MCNVCEQEPCQCGNSTAYQFRETYRPQPMGITKEEFGVQLYNTIKTIGGLLGLQEQLQAAMKKGQSLRIKELKGRQINLRLVLADHLKTLTDDEMRQILEHYPQVGAL